MRRRTMFAVGVALALVTAGCGDDDDSADTGATAAPAVTEVAGTDAPVTDAAATTAASAGEDVKLAFVTKFPVEFFTAMEDAAKAYAEEHEGIDIEYFSCQSPSDVDCQIAQIEDAVVKGFDAMVITPMGNDVIPALDAAVDDGMIVVLADNDLPDFAAKTAVAATDNVKGGQAAGEYLKTVLQEGDTIGLMEGVRGVPALDARIQGVQAALEGSGVEVILGGAETQCDSARGATVAEDLLTREPDLTAIYSACDDPAISAAKVASDQGKDVLIMGYDGLPTAAQAILDGAMTATIAQFPGRMAELGVEAAVNAVRGEPVEPFIDTGTELVTSENAEQFLQFQ
ncbi:MAG TPA: sugar ABC transporter substrate-binding protein [Acidimicrobiales bacterium]|jgi:simple sugar transport system substrate-binding protein|nr:sugar ABC transporter substrate-binding protein [Acidimicrobiales bacterium]